MTESNNNQDHDSPWKEALELRFPEFLALLFPHVYALINWQREVIFLDKELQQILPNAENGRTYADKLVQVECTDGIARWVLIHVEVQGEPEADFARRMYRYNYRINDKYDKDVISLAVLTDVNKKFRPDHFRFELGGCEISFKFPMVKLLDWQDRLEELYASDNVFALIVAAQLHAKLNKAPEHQLDAKKQLIRLLYQRGYTHQQLLELFRLIDWMITLPHNLDIEFKVLVDQIEEEQKMAYVTSVERIAMQEGWMKGQQEGWMKGQQEGKLEGKLEAAQTMVKDFGISVKDAATKLKVPLDDLIDYLNKHEQSKS
ncbi:RpnC/YadD family protein [Thiomicrospira cyclica]|uniref:Transposase (putative) YhgA-like domain-containing protein n=1 Tax=Thiomicrospira cyclica (strain DSM 14477 / JCM 11371 / ALM1) TaxID=717773 RepID=F6D939_THICA|nr:hypothetical protein [Thiomicrospira cyclica]AEG30870.1 hypothetical protein Thicy_0094 [Thiomicrospira cyclica ALM1]